jgi:D-cysteine desulfhydrase
VDETAILPSTRRTPLLFDALPALARRVPWRQLAHLPTPVARCDAIAGWLGRADVWMKRDDLASPLWGGNKVRRYEFVLAKAEAERATRLVTAGGLASTQVVATALFGKVLGFRVRVVFFEQPITRFAKYTLLIGADSGAELIWGGNYLTTTIRMISALARDRREGNYLILPGASDPISNLGYVDAMLELAEQVERGELPRPDAIVLPTGSSGTLAALALGAAWLGWDTEIVGVRIAARWATNALSIGMVIAATDRFLQRADPGRWKGLRRQVRWSLRHDAVGQGYGYPTPGAIEGIERLRTLTGAPGEVTYSGKALDGLRTILREPRWHGKNVLLWNTLSTPRPSVSPDAREKVPRALRWVLDAPEVA